MGKGQGFDSFFDTSLKRLWGGSNPKTQEAEIKRKKTHTLKLPQEEKRGEIRRKSEKPREKEVGGFWDLSRRLLDFDKQVRSIACLLEIEPAGCLLPVGSFFGPSTGRSVWCGVSPAFRNGLAGCFYSSLSGKGYANTLSVFHEVISVDSLYCNCLRGAYRYIEIDH